MFNAVSHERKHTVVLFLFFLSAYEPARSERRISWGMQHPQHPNKKWCGEITHVTEMELPRTALRLKWGWKMPTPCLNVFSSIKFYKLARDAIWLWNLTANKMLECPLLQRWLHRVSAFASRKLAFGANLHQQLSSVSKLAIECFCVYCTFRSPGRLLWFRWALAFFAIKAQVNQS